MAPGPAPLHEAAIRIGKVGSAFYGLYDRTKSWPWPFGGLAGFFHQAYVECYSMAHWLYTASGRIETLDWDAFIWSPGAWVLVRMGADIGRAVYYRHAPWAWVIWKFRKEHPIVDAIWSWDFRWVWNYLRNRWPELPEIVHHPGRWLLVKSGADLGRANFYQYEPWRWFIWRFRKEHLLLDALLSYDLTWILAYILGELPDLNEIRADPIGWVFHRWQDSIDRYIDSRIDWLVATCGRVINLIWEARV